MYYPIFKIGLITFPGTNMEVDNHLFVVDFMVFRNRGHSQLPCEFQGVYVQFQCFLLKKTTFRGT